MKIPSFVLSQCCNKKITNRKSVTERSKTYKKNKQVGRECPSEKLNIIPSSPRNPCIPPYLHNAQLRNHHRCSILDGMACIRGTGCLAPLGHLSTKVEQRFESSWPPTQVGTIQRTQGRRPPTREGRRHLLC